MMTRKQSQGINISRWTRQIQPNQINKNYIQLRRWRARARAYDIDMKRQKSIVLRVHACMRNCAGAPRARSHPNIEIIKWSEIVE